MPLDITVDRKKLIDSPLNESNVDFFNYTDSDTESFVQELLHGHPSCFLVSGYRGSGKSSFIKKVEIDADKKNSKMLFIYLNFAKYEQKTILLRKLIRNFYLCFEKSLIYEKLKNDSSFKGTILKFKDLYLRTFFNVSKNSNRKNIYKKTSSLAVKMTLKEVLIFLSSLILSIIPLSAFGIDRWYSWLLSSIPLISLWSWFSYEIIHSKEIYKSSEVSKNTIYDDEIAEHYLIEILTALKPEVSPVFILDELDKINSDKLVEDLINELKPMMLSGHANFVIVAGQNLYYRYYFGQNKDDDVLSSLFSKSYHVSLFPSSEFVVLFDKITNNARAAMSDDESKLLDAYLDYLIFQSKRTPRRFITLIKQNIILHNNTTVLRIEKTEEELNIYSKVLRQLQIIDEIIASEEYPDPIRDYLNMQLALKAQKILDSRDSIFDLHSL